jgi:glycosyltransferase involved in cell wall biosynthesis
VHGIARALVHAGYHVVVGCGADEPTAPELLEREGCAELTFVGIGESGRREYSRVRRAVGALLMQGARTIAWLDAQPIKPSHVIVYGGYASFMARILPWCRRHRVPVVADVVEWYDGRHVAGGRFGPFYAASEIAMRLQYPRCDGIIAISRYLERHYLERGSKVVRVPPTLDVVSCSMTDRAAGLPLRLIYAGTPGKKDLLRSVIAGVQEVDPAGERIQLDVLGPTVNQVEGLCGTPLPRSIIARGRVPQPEVARAYLGSDLSVLLREPLRFAQAGFPTKVPESLAAGVPVICNTTSDIGMYVRDGVEGFLCADHTAASFAATLRRVIAEWPSRYSEMRSAARGAAERFFDYRQYSATLSTFLKEIAP